MSTQPIAVYLPEDTWEAVVDAVYEAAERTVDDINTTDPDEPTEEALRETIAARKDAGGEITAQVLLGRTS